MRKRTVLLGGLMALLLVGAAAWWFTGRESPDAVDLDRAIEDLAQADSDADVETEDDGEDLEPSGRWSVDPDAIPFDAATGSGTWVGYRVDEELSGIGAYEAVGRSPRVSGEIVLEGTSVTEAEIRADLVGLVSDNANRDARVRPIFTDRPVVFTLAEPVDFGSIPAEGQRVAVSARGILAIGDVAREVAFELSADVQGRRLVVAGSTMITLADFDVQVPSAPIVLSASDEATIELLLYLTRG